MQKKYTLIYLYMYLRMRSKTSEKMHDVTNSSTNKTIQFLNIIKIIKKLIQNTKINNTRMTNY